MLPRVAGSGPVTGQDAALAAVRPRHGDVRDAEGIAVARQEGVRRLALAFRHADLDVGPVARAELQVRRGLAAPVPLGAPGTPEDAALVPQAHVGPRAAGVLEVVRVEAGVDPQRRDVAVARLWVLAVAHGELGHVHRSQAQVQREEDRVDHVLGHLVRHFEGVVGGIGGVGGDGVGVEEEK